MSTRERSAGGDGGLQAATGVETVLTRREVVRRVVALLGAGGCVGGQALLGACVARDPITRTAAAGFTALDIALLDEVAETILPATSTPGAKAAGVGPFIAVMVTDVYSPADRRVFRDGMTALDAESIESFGSPFLDAAAAERTALLERLDAEQVAYMRARRANRPAHYFRMMKELTLLGYFTSEIGCTVAQRYLETPGRFEPCVPYAPGERAWAAHA